jgi:hypothetical protein
MLGHPDSVVGLADGGAHYGMICDASFPTYFLTRWARDAQTADRISLPQAIAALTAERDAAGKALADALAAINSIWHVDVTCGELPEGQRKAIDDAFAAHDAALQERN